MGLGFRVVGLEFRVSGLGSRVWGSEFRDSGCRVHDSGLYRFRFLVSGVRVQNSVLKEPKERGFAL